MATIESIGDGRVWSAPDLMATEYEVSSFIGALVKMLKPMVAVETGCYLGQTTDEIGQSLPDGAVLYTCDTDPEKVAILRDTCLSDKVIITEQTGTSLIASLPKIDFAFLDSGGDRVEEALCLVKSLSDGGIVALHDSHRPACDDIEKLTKWKCVRFNTPRGLALFQK